MFIQVITCHRNKGTGRESGKAFDFQVVGGLMTTARGTEFVEMMLDGDAPTPELGKKYEVEISFYPNREKRLAFRVEGLRPIPSAQKAA
jgi:hypothetical protein